MADMTDRVDKAVAGATESLDQRAREVFRNIVESFNQQYSNASKHEKTEIIRQVIQKIQSAGADFLIMENGSVKKASADEIRMKVSHRFRDFSKGSSSRSSPAAAQANGAQRASPKLLSPATGYAPAGGGGADPSRSDAPQRTSDETGAVFHV